MPRYAIVTAAVVMPVAVAGAIELWATIGSAPVGRSYVARFAGSSLLIQLGLALLVGMALARLTTRREEAAALHDAAAVAAGLATGLSTLFVLVNGAPPLIQESRPGSSGILAIAVGATVVAAVVRKILPCRHGLAAIAVEPVLIAAAIQGAYLVLTRVTAFPTSRRALFVWLGAAVACLLAASLVQRHSSPWPERGVAKILIAVPVMVAVAGITAVLVGRSALPALPTRTDGPPDILLLVLDTTRSDFAPAGPEAPVPTPNLSRMAAEGVRFTRAFSTSCWTLPAHGSLFTGLVPSEHGATWSSEHFPDGVSTLAEQLQDAGRRTGAFSANPWITPEFGFDRGFERFFVGDADRHPMKPGLVGSLPALFSPLGAATLYEDAGGLVVASEALSFLGSDDRPAFVFLNLMEPHLPYIPPDRFLAASPDGEWNRRSLDAVDQDLFRDLRPGGERSRREIDGLRRLYAGEVAYVDWLLGRILDRLEDSDRLDDTLVVVTSDHGENLGQHPPLDHQLGLFDTLVHVPLLIRYPSVFPAGAVRDDLVSLVDVPVALLSLARGDTDDPGGPILDGPPRRAVFIEYARPGYILQRIRDRLGIDPAPWDRTLRGVRTSELKWIEASDGRHEAYDLRTDPGEQRNLVDELGTVPATVAPLAGILDEVSARWVPRADSEPPPPISEETAERLRSLGYLP